MYETMDFENWKQRREEMLREGELSRRTRALRATRDGRAREGNSDDKAHRA